VAQLSLRLADDLAKEVKMRAAASGRSVNGWIVAVLRAAVDPELADSEAERIRARLARAGLLVVPTGTASARPEPTRLQAARRAAGRGTPLSQLVTENRG
jgi:plasmid stability protein